MPPRILEPGRNCWRLAHADRVSFLIDAGPYFEALVAAAVQAKRTLYILGWDLHSRVHLRLDETGAPELGSRHQPTLDDGRAELARFLDGLVEMRPDLEIYINVWDFHVLYLREREMFQHVKLGLRSHERIHFVQDGVHRFCASHHQKVVVIDDSIAFAGGIDLTFGRWDTCEHRGDDARRVDRDGKPVRPFHDAQMAVSGEAARALGDLFRERWRNATGGELAPPRVESDLWPAALAIDLEDVEVAISRTDTTSTLAAPVLEVEELWLDSLAAARRSIYIENQYLTSGPIAAAIAERLRDPDGPEVVLVTPREQCDWLEEGTMGVLRDGFLNALGRADLHGRLRVLYPVVPGIEGECLNVHSKLLIVDDELVRIGSANLSERSMRLDTECDLTVEASGRARVARAIAALRHRLLGEHLGLDCQLVARVERELGSSVATIDVLRGGIRTLVPLEWGRRGWIRRAAAKALFADGGLRRLGRRLTTPALEKARQLPARTRAEAWADVAVVAAVAAIATAALTGAWRAREPRAVSERALRRPLPRPVPREAVALAPRARATIAS